MSTIPLVSADGSLVAQAQIDEADQEWLSSWTWRFHRTGYAWRCERPGGRAGKLVAVFMHREILGLPRSGRDIQGDHINRDRLDNRRSNLRVVSHSENMRNRSSFHDSASRYSGVSRASKNRWQAAVKVDGKCHYLGCFAVEEEAAAAVLAFKAESCLVVREVDRWRDPVVQVSDEVTA